jgi:hypothetical protein
MRGLWLLVQTEFSVKSIYSSTGINQLLSAGVERVTLGTDFYFDIFLCASRFNNLSASAPNSRLLIFRMDSYFHNVHLFLVYVVYAQR